MAKRKKRSRSKKSSQKRTPKHILKSRLIPALVLAAFSFILLTAADISSGFADFYSENIYSVIAGFISRITGIFPFSAAEILLCFFIVFWIILLIHTLVRKRPLFRSLACYILDLVLFAAILFFIYTTCCGINYRRTSFAEESGIGTVSYDADDLEKVCEHLVSRINELSPQIMRDDSDIFILTSRAGTAAKASMTRLGTYYDSLSGYYPQPKGLIFSYFMSASHLTGIYSPFTVEANYNRDMPGFYIPFAACHELSHLRGFMQEEEANFIGFLACITSVNIEFNYSGYLIGWIYAGNQLRSADRDAYDSLYAALDAGAQADLRENSRFWSEYDGRAAEVSSQVNDTYLKANGQSDGVMSYNRMVDLMVAYYMQEN